MTYGDERVWRNVRPNEVTRIPRRHIFFDTEARIRKIGGGHEQTWRLGVASFVSLRKDRAPSETTKDYRTPSELWDDITGFAGRNGRTILWAHNIGYDTRISGALSSLPERGWTLAAHNITSRNTWLEWRKDKSTLLMVDSKGVFPTTLAQIGKWFGLGKVRMDLDSEDDSAWFNRCRTDVAILQTAIVAYLSWLEDADMGNWQITGAGQSWATFRHKFLTHKMVIHNEEEILVAERRAMWAGRCEAYWHGEINFQTVHEWDFTSSYPTIARDYPVPVRLLGPMPQSYDWRNAIKSPNVALLAECVIETPVPCVPTSKDGRILWPVGTFRTTLWDPEISAAIASGATVTIERAWLYRARPALKAWGEWILNRIVAPDNEVPAWQKAVLKHHSRALIGRMAMTYNQWGEFAEADSLNVQRAKMWDAEEEREYELMQIGKAVWIDEGRVEWPQSMPMVTGYIQSIARVQLWNVMKLLPERTLLYVDTDSLIVTHNNLDAVDRIARLDEGKGLRLKRSWDGFATYGPRQIVTGEQIRMSGVPHTAKHVARREYTGEVWDSLSGSIGRGNPSAVVTRDRTWHISGVDNRRTGGIIGWTEPIRVEEGE